MKPTEHTINLKDESFGIIGSPNIRRLERVLGISVIERINTEIAAHIKKISQYKFITEKAHGVFNLYIKPPRKPKVLFLCIEHGLLWDKDIKESKVVVGLKKYLRNAPTLNCFRLKNRITNHLIIDDELQMINSKINELARQDLAKIENRPNSKLQASRYFLSKLNILTTEHRIQEYTKAYYTYEEEVAPDDYGITFDYLISSWDIEKPIAAVNRYIIYRISLIITEIILPQYTAALAKHRNLYSTASKMQIPHQSLLVVPQKYRDRFFALYHKYPFADSLVTKYKDLVKFDNQQLILNDAHPKLIKELVVSFYQSISPIPLAKKMITKVLRLNKKAFFKKNHNKSSLYNSFRPFQDVISFDLFILAMFSNMPQIRYLDNYAANKAKIHDYFTTFIKLLKFLRHDLRFTDKLEICRNSLNSSIINYDEFRNTIANLDSELYRLNQEVGDPHRIVSKAISITIVSQRKLTVRFLRKAHDYIISGIVAYQNEKKDSHLTEQQFELLNTKIIDKECYQNYIFEQLVTRSELSQEGDLMHHCVGSYYGSNLNQLFIFAVYPETGDRLQKTDNRSTLAIQVSYKKRLSFSISQNYTFCNGTPAEANRVACTGFVKHIKDRHKREFVEYINKLVDNQTERKKRLINRTEFINQIANNIQIMGW